eukprot:gene21988-29046_t
MADLQLFWPSLCRSQVCFKASTTLFFVHDAAIAETTTLFGNRLSSRASGELVYLLGGRPHSFALAALAYRLFLPTTWLHTGQR